MKKFFTKSGIVLSAILFFLSLAIPALAQYNETTLEQNGLYSALAKDAANNIYVTRVKSGTNGQTYEVVKYTNPLTNPGATPVVVYTGLTHGTQEFPWGLAVASNGDVYISTDFTDTNKNGEIIKVTAASNYATSSSYLTGKYFTALTIANDQLYTAQYNSTTSKYDIVRYATGASAGTGTVIRAGLGSSGYSYITGLAVDGNGTTYIAAPFDGVDKGNIIKITSSGTESVISAGGYPSALAVDAQNNLYASEFSGTSNQYKLTKYSTAGGSTIIKSNLSQNGFYYPWGIAETNSSLFVVDGDDGTNGGKVIILKPIIPAPSTPVLAAGSDSGISNSDQITNAVNPVLTGTAEANATVKLYEGGTLLGSTLATNGTWSITLSTALTAGVHKFTATATNSSNITSALSGELSITVDLTSPSVTISSSSITLKAGETANITFTFSENPGNTFTWDGSSGDITVSGGTLSALSGTGLIRTAIFTPAANTNNGVAGISVAAASYTDIAGNAGAAAPNQTITFDTQAPAATSVPFLRSSSDSGQSNVDGITNVTTPIFTGTAEPGTTITLYDNGSTIIGSVVATGGVWLITSTSLSTGAHNITASARDAAGNTGPVSGALSIIIDNVAPVAPSQAALTGASDSGISTTDGITNITKPTFTGTAEAGATVRLYDTDGTTELGSGVSNLGLWSITIISPLAAGTHTLRAKATDVAGNTSIASNGLTITIDLTPPVVSGVINNSINTAPVSLNISINEGTATLNGNPFPNNTNLSAVGTYELIATDLAGNSTTVNFRIDKATPVITWANPGDITYGTPLTATQLNATASVPGTLTYLPVSGTVLNAGANQNLSVNFVPTDAANYASTTKTVSINVGKATPVITWANPGDITYGTALTATQLNATASVAGTFTYLPAAGTVLTTGANQNLKVDFVPTDAANYASTSKTVTINVGKATPVITWANPADITYGTTLTVAQLNATANVPGTLTYTPNLNTVLNAGATQNLKVDFIPTDAVNYASASKTVTINVSKATPVITWTNPADITYGTPLTVTQLNATASVPGTLTYLPIAGTVLNAGASQNLKVDFVPTDAANYNSTTKTVSINVGKATPVITWANPADITYGTALTATQLNATANVPGTLTYLPVSGTVLSAGASQNLSVNFVPANAANYNSTSKTVTINVGQATPVITWANPGDITYGTALTATQLNATASVAGTFTYLPVAGTVLTAGANQNLKVDFVPTDAANYASTSKTVTINVGKATPVITWANPADITYGTALTGAQLNATANVPGTLTYIPDLNTVLNAGATQTLKVDFVPTDAANYASTSKTVTINVGKATPVITWTNPADITYGTALTATQLNATASVPGTFTYLPVAGTVLNAGANQNLKVDFVPTDAANYASTSKTVTINVSKATPLITWTIPADITYGTALTATQLNATANVPGTLTYLPVSGTVLSAGASQNLKVDFVPANAANYNSTSKTVTINVAQATPVITWANPADITYGTALTATQLNATANVPGTLTYTPNLTTVLDAGANQNLKVDFVPTDAVNYASTSKTVTINVGKAIPVITWANPADLTYGTALTGTQLNATANVPGTLTYLPVSGTVLSAGSNQNLKVDFVPTDVTNYASTNKTVSINVIKATPVITWANPADITYGTALTGTQLNATASVPGTLTYLPVEGTVLNAGANQNLKVDFIPTDAVNYTSGSKTVTINVGKATPVITWANPADINDGTALTSIQLNATVNVPGTLTYLPVAGTVLNTGANQNLKVDFNPTDAANYIAVSKTVTINVGKATPVITWANPADITFGTPLSATQLNASASVPGTLIYLPVSGTVLDAGINQNLTVDFVPTDATKYKTTSKTVTINVGKATPVITWSNPADITFGTALTTTQLNATASVPGTLTYTPNLTTVLDAGVNQSLKVDFVPTDANNYTTTSKTVTIKVSKGTPVIAWTNPQDITFGTALTATQLNATVNVPGILTYSPVSGTILNAGANQNLKVNFIPTDVANYAPTSKTVTINVGKVTPVITWANPADINFGTALTATQLNATANVPGTLTYLPVSGTVLNAGANQTLKVDFVPTDVANYVSTSKTVTINVGKVTPVITWANPQDITFGTALTGTQLNATANVPGTLTYLPVSGTVLNAGANQTLKVDFVPTDVANYVSTSKTVTINVGKVTPVITWANPADIIYGTALTATQLNATANVPGSLTYTPNLNTVLNAGATQTLKVDFIPTDAANYASTSKTVTINVSKGTPVITWTNPADIIYGTALTATQLNATANVPGILTYSPVSGTVLNAGANQNLKVDFVPTDVANYVPTSKTVTITVGKVTPVITWANPQDITFGTALTATQLNATANVPGTLTYSPVSGTVLGAGANQSLKVDFVPTNASNYNAVSKTVTINVGKVTPVITWANPADIIFGTALGATQLNATASVPGTLTYQPVLGTVLNAGSNQNLKVDFVPTDAASFTAVSKTVTINVGKATPVITWANPADIVFGTALTATQLNATANVPGTLTYTPNLNTVLNAGATQTLKVDFIPTDAANYASTSKTVTINVGKATPVITWANPADIIYGTPLTATQLNATANVPGTFTYTPNLNAVLNAGAAQSLKVDFVATDAVNYASTSKTVTINVGKPTPVITWTNPADIIFGTALTTTQLNATANVPGTFTYIPNLNTVLNAGANQTLKVDFVPADAANYASTSKTVTINVGKATPVITWANPAAITYGTALTATQLNATTNVPGTLTYTPNLNTVLNAGANQSLKVDFIPTDAANYTVASKIVSLDINRKPVNANIVFANKIYDGNNSAAVSSIILNGVLSTDLADVLLTGFTASFADKNAGVAKVISTLGATLSGAKANNYTLSDVVSGTAAITPKPIVVTADAKSKTYGDADPLLTYTLSPGAMVAGDGLTGTLSRVAGENSGSYLINQNSLTAGANYIITFNNNNLIINRKNLVITLDNKTKPYLAANPPLTASYSGFAGSENSSVLTTPVNIATTATAASPSGIYPITGNGAVSANYAISYVAGTLTVLASPQTITFNVLADKLSTDPVFNLTATSSAGLTISYTSSNINIARIVNGNQVEILNPGTVVITASQAGDANYAAAASVSQRLTIINNPAPIISIVSNKGGSVSKGETASLTASGAVTYQWSNANGIISGQNTATLTVRPNTNTTYTVTGFNQFGRSSTQSFTLEVRADFQVLNIMNVLTPNGDGKNDTWIIENIDMYPNNLVKVFDRAGKSVFEMKGYNNTWDGTFKGNVLPEGSYYYIIDFGQGIGIRKGYISIIGQ